MIQSVQNHLKTSRSDLVKSLSCNDLISKLSGDYMSEIGSLAISYRLETKSDIVKAMQSNLLGLGDQYEKILEFASTTKLHKPIAFKKAREVVQMDFSIVKQKIFRECKVTYEEIADLDFINHFSTIESRIPWINELADYDGAISYLRCLPESIITIFAKGPFPTEPTKIFEAFTSFRKLLHREVLYYAKARKTRHFDIDQLKKAMVCLTLFEQQNGDVLNGIREGIRHHANRLLYENAVAELLLSRLPGWIDHFIILDPKVIRQKFISRINRLSMSQRQKTNLYGYFRVDAKRENLKYIFRDIISVSQRMNIPDDVKKRIHDYLSSLERTFKTVDRIYSDLFLDKDLLTLKRLHVPRNVMKSRLTYMDSILKAATYKTTLMFYPTKDYLDLYRGLASSDCTVKTVLGQEHLRIPNFFNVRIFKDSNWVGNIYLLDFTLDHGVILIDRIQMPRETAAEFIKFFDHLKEVLQEMFRDVSFKEVLMPIKISNHDKLQRSYNIYRERLARRNIELQNSLSYFFEGLNRMNNYYVLYENDILP